MRIARISGATSRTREPTVDGGVLLGYQELAQVVRTWRHGCDPGAAEAVPGSGTQHRLALKPKDHREPPLVMRRSQRHTSYLEWVMEQDSRPALLQRPRMHSAKKNHLCLTFTMMRQMWTCGFCSSGLCAKLRGLWHGSAPKCCAPVAAAGELHIFQFLPAAEARGCTQGRCIGLRLTGCSLVHRLRLLCTGGRVARAPGRRRPLQGGFGRGAAAAALSATPSGPGAPAERPAAPDHPPLWSATQLHLRRQRPWINKPCPPWTTGTIALAAIVKSRARGFAAV